MIKMQAECQAFRFSHTLLLRYSHYWSMMAAAAAAAASSALRSKPQKYTAADGKIIVENEFLDFLAITMKTMAQG